jgi:IS30 family transposase
VPIDFPDDETMRVTHEAIYQALFVQGPEVLRRQLTACLRIGRVVASPRARRANVTPMPGADRLHATIRVGVCAA